jgi:hypothetical protein
MDFRRCVLAGVGFLLLGLLIFSTQDVSVKWISGD